MCCCRTVPLNTQSSLQISKRRLEFGVDVETFRASERRLDRTTTDFPMDEDDVITKRRRRLLDDERHDTEPRRRPHPMHRPTIMRQSDNDDETLIQETQAALKTLSSNWTRNPSLSPHSTDENDGFENLFNDQRSDKMLPSSPSQSSESADTSQRSYSYRSRQAEEPISNGNHGLQVDNEDRNESDRAKSEEYEEHTKYSSYDGANFNELGDSSSNELEIDMSDRCDDDDMASKLKRKSEISVNKQSLYNAYKAATAALPYSTQSAFKPPAEVKHRLHNPSLPSEPFGGYSADHEKSLQKVSKQYTVLQPAGAGSRAATALQEARTVPTAQPARDSRPLAALSPSASRGIPAEPYLLESSQLS